MANPNPFLFDTPGAGGMEPPNPFLSGEDPTAVANPFLSGGMSAPVAPQMQMQYGAFGTPQPTADAANPFASAFAAVPPAPAVQSSSSLSAS